MKFPLELVADCIVDSTNLQGGKIKGRTYFIGIIETGNVVEVYEGKLRRLRIGKIKGVPEKQGLGHVRVAIIIVRFDLKHKRRTIGHLQDPPSLRQHALRIKS
jgi:hypothetical protein